MTETDNKILDKALDKACKIVSQYLCCDGSKQDCNNDCTNCWKERLLKDEQ